MTCVPPVILNASFNAFSFASAPEFTKKIVSRPRPQNAARRVAARLRTSSGTALLWKHNERACSESASTQRGCP
jgi:hypothetical protein